MDWSDSERMILSSFWSLKTCMDTMGYSIRTCVGLKSFFLVFCKKSLFVLETRTSVESSPSMLVMLTWTLFVVFSMASPVSSFKRISSPSKLQSCR
jgi:hypothetical protein